MEHARTTALGTTLLVSSLLTAARMKKTALLVVSSLWFACPAPVPTPPPSPPCDLNTETCVCIDDSNCGAGFYCDTQRSLCIVDCDTDVDCNVRAAPLPRCEGMGCWCESGSCVPRQCSTDADCGGQVCRNALCTAPSPDSEVSRCEVHPDFAVVQPGDRVAFEVLAWNAIAAPHVSSSGPTWLAPSPLVGTSPRANALTVEVGAALGALPSVTAQWGGVTCSAQLQVLPAPAAGEVVVSVVDETSGRPVTGARVLVSDDAGAVVQQSGADFVLTDASGVVVLRAVGTAPTVSVFHAAYGYQTIVASSARTLRFVVRRNPLDLLGGVQSGFSSEPLDSNLRLARAGLSTLGDLTNLELTDDGEPTVATNLQIGSAVSSPNTPVPFGTFMNFGSTVIKPRVTTFGAPSVCAGVADGSCGTQAAWALTGSLPLADVPLDIFLTDGRLEFMPTLLRLSMRGRAFGSSVVRDARFSFQPTPGVASGQPDFTATGHFTRQDHVFNQVPNGFVFGVRTPLLSRGPAGFPDQVLCAGVVHVEGRGVVPLGFGARPNVKPNDGEVDSTETPAGHLRVTMAPAHHGLEGRPYELLTVARYTQYRQVAWLGRASSTLETRIGNALPFAPGLASVGVDQRSEAMLSPPQGSFDFVARRFTGTAVAGADVLRVRFVDRTGARWDVLADAAQPSFVLPMPPLDLMDRVFLDGARQSVQRSEVLLVAARHGRPFGEVVSTVQTRPTAWAEHALRPLALVPLFGEGATFGRGAMLEVAVEGFQPGVDGAVRVSFPGAACLAFTVPPVGHPSGVVSFTVPASCSGRFTVRAELVDRADQPLAPAVASETTIVVTQ